VGGPGYEAQGPGYGVRGSSDNGHLRGVLGILDIRVVRLSGRLYVRSYYRHIIVPLNGILHVVLCLCVNRFN
jgi:hypothetical protein